MFTTGKIADYSSSKIKASKNIKVSDYGIFGVLGILILPEFFMWDLVFV